MLILKFIQQQTHNNQLNLLLSKSQLQNQLKSAQSQAQARQNQIQQIQRELQHAKDNLQQNLANQKELQQTQQTSQQSYNQEVTNLKTALSQAESKVRRFLITVIWSEKTQKENLPIFIHVLKFIIFSLSYT